MKKFISLILLLVIALCSYNCYIMAGETAIALKRAKNLDWMYTIVVGQVYVHSPYGGGVDGLITDPTINNAISEDLYNAIIVYEGMIPELVHDGVPVESQDWAIHWRIEEAWEKEVGTFPSLPPDTFPPHVYQNGFTYSGPWVSKARKFEQVDYDFIDAEGFMRKAVSKEEWDKHYHPKVITQHAAPTDPATPMEHKTLTPGLYDPLFGHAFVSPRQNNYKRYIKVKICIVVDGEPIEVDSELYETEDGKWSNVRKYSVNYNRVTSAPDLTLPPNVQIKVD